MRNNGVLVSAWVKIESGCAIEYRMGGANEVEFTLGGCANGFEFVATEDGLERLVAAGSQALRELHSGDEEE
nr:hypothetical protein [Kibdelosporangium sp. MJ126-NF4]